MDKDFDFQARVLMCRNCGAPLRTGYTGGSVNCSYCDTVNVFTPRREEHVEPLAAAREIAEEERMELLRRQDGTQPDIPAGIGQLLSGGRLAPWKETEALSIWRTTCGELASGSDISSAELLYFLTIILSNHYSETNDCLRQRALYESALEVLTLPRHRQQIRGMLARNAALAGDPEAGEKWLEPCNPRSEDLQSDSAYRVSKAEILTVKRDWKGVLEILGEDLETVPVDSTLDGKAIVQRANALEMTGREKEAAEQLSLYIQANGAQGRHVLEMITGVYAHSGLEVCPGSLKMADDQSSRAAGASEAEMENPGGCFGQIFAVTGVLLLLLTLGLTYFLGILKGEPVFGASLGVGITGIVFLIVGIKHIRAGRMAIRIHTRGIPAEARVRSITPTGWRINKVPQYAIELDVSLPGEAPYAVSLKKAIHDIDRQLYEPGSMLHVKVDPEDRSRVVLTG